MIKLKAVKWSEGLRSKGCLYYFLTTFIPRLSSSWLCVCVCVSLSYSQGVIWDKKTHYCFLHQQRLWNEKETTSPSNPCVCLCSMLVSPQPPCGQLCSLTSDFFLFFLSLIKVEKSSNFENSKTKVPTTTVDWSCAGTG